MTPVLDLAKTEAFAGQIVGILNSGALALMISIGHRTGLFDTLAELPPSTSTQIAAAAGLNERYVREWLGAMVTGQIVEYDASAKTYHLPPEHSACLTRSASPNNMAVTAQFIPLLATVEDQIIDCFYRGGGVPYSSYGRFHQIMAEDSGQTVVAALEDQILPLVPGLRADLERGIDVLDLGCGHGYALMKLARHFPQSRFRGYDFSQDTIAAAQAEAERQGLTNLQFQVQDAAQLREIERYDFICTFDAIHDQAHPDAVLQNIHRALRPTGTYLMQEIRGSSHVHGNLNHAIAPFLYTISCMHCMSVSLSVGGMGLGTMWGHELALAMLRDAGFTAIDVHQLEHDLVNSYFVVKKA